MPYKTLAVIDLGSNTFHLLIVQQSQMGFKTLYRDRAYTFLSEGGLDFISLERFNGAINIIEQFSIKLIEYCVDETKIIGTAALRSATNSSILTSKINDITGHKVEIIDGDREAQFIFDGIMCFNDFHIGNYLIIDIGGGSTEFIIVDDGIKTWSKSYPLGVGVLYSNFITADPITFQEIELITSYVSFVLADLKTALAQSDKSRTIIGASGSFEVLLTMSGKEIVEDETEPLTLNQFGRLYEMIINSSYTERQSIPGLPKERTKLIVMAMLLKHIVIKEICNLVEGMVFCPYSLKEGVLKEMS